MKHTRMFGLAMLFPSMTFLLLFLVAPIALLIYMGFFNGAGAFSLDAFAKVLNSGMYLRAMKITFLSALMVTAICILLAYPAAYLLSSVNGRTTRALFYVILVSPLMTSVVVRTFAWLVLLARNGLINQMLQFTGLIDTPLSMLWGMPAVTVAYVQVMLPFAVLPLAAVFSGMDPALVMASQSLGVGRIGTFFRTVLPLSLPGAVSGGLIVFALTAGSYITPLLVGGGRQPLLSLMIYQQSIQIMDLHMAGALSAILLLMVFAAMLPVEYLLKRWETRVYG